MLPYIEFFDKGVRKFPDRTFLVDEDASLTFRQASDLTHRIAGGLVLAGVGPDQPVATMTPNSVSGYCAQWGVIRAGMPWVPVNIRNGIDENVVALGRLGVRFIFFHSSLVDECRRLLEEVCSLTEAVCLDGAVDEFPGLVDWMPELGTLQVQHPRRGPDDIVSIPTTSGTTGRPKGVMLTNASFAAGVMNYQSLMSYDLPPVTLAVAPLTHGAGYFAGTLIPQGGSIVMLRSAEPQLVLEAIERHKVTTVFLPPTLLYAMVEVARARSGDYSSLRYVICGGAPMSADKLREAVDIFGPVFCQNYSQTESPVTVAFMTPRQLREALSDEELHGRLRSVGTEAPFTRFEIMAEDGTLLPPGSEGEIVVRGPLVMKGYYDDPDATAEVSTHGWHHTGDIGRVDEDSFLYVVDRKKDMIISGGFNVYPSEVEQAIWAYPGVLDCAVVGAPDDHWGEAVTAVIEAEEGATIDLEILRCHLRERLGGVKAPKQLHLWEELPRSSNGKVLKREIRDAFWAGLDRRI